MIKQIAKENIKALLSDNKKLISISFVALIQALKADPQMVKLIQNIPSTNDGEQHEDNNITKYVESNKNRILALTEKNYENLTEALTDNVVGSAVTASLSNPALLLRQPSTFFSLSYQIDTSNTEESENFHNNKGNIAD